MDMASDFEKRILEEPLTAEELLLRVDYFGEEIVLGAA
jgi:hypothetical protein